MNTVGGFRTSRGFGLLELLIASVIMIAALGLSAAFLAQQSRVTQLSQATNDAEVTARTVAEAFVQDLQLSGSRATYVDGLVTYNPPNASCTETDRTGCVEALRYASDGAISAVPLGETPNGYSIWYRTSLTPAPEECRRIDFALIGDSLYRSDIACDSTLAAIDLGESLFATNVQGFGVVFTCSDGTTTDTPVDCFSTDPSDFVQMADVIVQLTSGGRTAIESNMEMRAYTPNLRPSVNYGRTE